MSSLPKNAIVNLAKKYLDINIPELREENDYIQLLGMLKKVKTQNKGELNLLIHIFEKMFLHQNKFKIIIEEEKFNKFIDLINLESSFIEQEENNKDYAVIKKCLSEVKMINEKEIFLLYNLMNIEKNKLMFFKYFQEIISSKDKCFIENKDIKLGNINYYTLLFYIKTLFQIKEENNEEYYTYRINGKRLFKGKATNEEVENYIKTNKEIEKNEIFTFINKLEKNIVTEKNNSNLNNNMEAQQEKINPINNEVKVISNVKPNLEDEIMKLKNLLKDMKEQHNKDIKDMKEQHNKDIKDMSEKYNKNIKDMKEQHNKDIKDINSKYKKEIDNLNSKYKKEIDNLNSKYKKEIDNLNVKNNNNNENLKKKMNERTDKKINNLKDQIKDLKTVLNNIKIRNDQLLKEKETILKKNQDLGENLALIKIESEKEKSEIRNNLKEVKKEKNKYQLENELMKSRDSSKYIIDFLYTVLNNKIDFTIKYEKKVNDICEAIKKNTYTEDIGFVENLCTFLNKIYNEKVKGDKLTHDDKFKSYILEGNKDLNTFFTNYLGIQNYFKNFKPLYFSNIKNKESEETKMVVLNICKEINFFDSLNDFSKRNN